MEPRSYGYGTDNTKNFCLDSAIYCCQVQGGHDADVIIYLVPYCQPFQIIETLYSDSLSHFQHYHPIEANNPLFIHDNKFCKSRKFLIIDINMFKKKVKKK